MKKRIPFYVIYKETNTGKMEYYDVMGSLYGSIFNSNGSISKTKFHIWDDKTYERKEIKTKKDLKKFIDSHFMYCYRYKCEWEFIALDWPTCKEDREVKVDVYHQLKPNIDLITDIVWEQIKDKILK